MKKILFYNLFVFLVIVFIFELSFGYWLDKNNFGFFIRNERLIEKHFEVVHNNKKFTSIYKRNFYGLRGEEVNPSEIKIVFEGGSTGNQKFTPENFTIVGILNNLLLKDNIYLKIYNASTDGKTTKGYINDFNLWFSKIKNFNPKIFIFYIGINDSNKFQPIKYDTGIRNSWPEQSLDYFKNNSITYELLLKVYNKYFSKLRLGYYPNSLHEGLYNNYKYIDYKEAKISFLHTVPSEEEKLLIKIFRSRLNSLNTIIKDNNITPIFISQIQFNGLNNKNLFLVNEQLKKFALNNNYYIIKLDEIINNIGINDFYDHNHTQISGSKKIANAIYIELKEILINEF